MLDILEEAMPHDKDSLVQATGLGVLELSDANASG